MAEGYGDIKGVMLAERPAEGRGPAGSPGGAPKAFRTAASVSHGEPLGLQPPVDRAGLATREDGKRSAAAKRGGAHPLGSGSRLHGNALTKHRKWLGALQRTMRQARDQWEAVEERAEARKSRFEGFSAALRATIRAGGDVQVRRRPCSAPPPPALPRPRPPAPGRRWPARSASSRDTRACLEGIPPRARRAPAEGEGAGRGRGGLDPPPPSAFRSGSPRGATWGPAPRRGDRPPSRPRESADGKGGRQDQQQGQGTAAAGWSGKGRLEG